MNLQYPLKKSDHTDLVTPIIKYLEMSESIEVAASFLNNLTKINQLRDQVCAFEVPSSLEKLNEFIVLTQTYIQYAMILAKHINWSSTKGIIITDLKFVWHDSFNSTVNFVNRQINLDIFCCFYNLGIMYFHKAYIQCKKDLIEASPQSIKSAKKAFRLFSQTKNVYYQAFTNTGFSDTSLSNLQMLQLLSQGLIYKNVFNSYQADEFKIGINNIACIAGQAQKRFYNAYQIGVKYFMTSSTINAKLKSELLSFAYVEALYHDAMTNTKYAKYYQHQMDNDKDNIINLIAYQRKAVRFLQLGLKNQSVKHLLDSRPQQKKELQNILDEIKTSLQFNRLRNQEIYLRKELDQQQMPQPMQTPASYIYQAIESQNIKINYEDPIAAPFQKLIGKKQNLMTFKMIIIGNMSVGKSCLINRFTLDTYRGGYSSTLGVQFYSKLLRIDQQTYIKIQIWDTAGQQQYRSLIRSYYKDSAAVFLVYNITNEQSFLDLQYWYNEAKQYCKQNAIFSLIGAQNDRQNQRKVTREKAEQFKKQKEDIAFFFQTSSLTSKNVAQAFQSVAKKIKIDGISGYNKKRLIVISDNTQKSCSC